MMAGVESPSALTPAIRRHAELGELDHIKKYVEADPALVNAEGPKRHIPLHLACRNNHVSTAAYLLERGCNLEAQDVHLNTPLLVAVLFGHLQTVRLLLDHQANANARNRNLETGLHLASSRCMLPVLEALLRGGANPLTKDKEGRTPLEVVGTKVISAAGDGEEEEGDLTECQAEIKATLEAAMSRWRTTHSSSNGGGGHDDGEGMSGELLEGAKLKTELAEMEGSVLQLTSQLAAARWQNASLQVVISNSRSKGKRLEEELQGASGRQTELEGQVAAQREVVAMLQAQLEQTVQAKARVEEEKGELAKQLEGSRAEAAALQGRVEALLSSEASLQGEVEGARARARELEGSVEALTRELASSESALKHERARAATVRAELQAAEKTLGEKQEEAAQRIAGLEGEVRALQEHKATLEAVAAQVDKRLHEAEAVAAAAVKGAQGASEVADVKIKQLAGQLQASKRHGEECEEKIKALRQQVVELEMGQRVAEGQASEASKAKDMEVQGIRVTLSQLQLQMQQQHQHMAELEHALVAERSSKAGVVPSSELEAINRQLVEARETIRRLESQVAKDKADLDTEEAMMTNFTKALEAQLNEERSFRDMVEERNAQLEATVKRMTAEASKPHPYSSLVAAKAMAKGLGRTTSTTGQQPHQPHH